MTKKHFMLFEVSARLLLSRLSAQAGRKATLSDVPDAWFRQLAGRGFDAVWLMGVWQTGEAGRRIALSRKDLLTEWRKVLPRLRPEDVAGSPYAVQEYRVHRDFGGDEALAAFRRKLAEHGVRLILDFVPNHVALDHPWVNEHPGFFIPGTTAALEREPANYVKVGDRVLAHGRDPHFPGWSDTLQLNYADEGLREAMRGVLERIAGMCDGVRCDMALLVLREVFAKTWGERFGNWREEFWPSAVARIRRSSPGFLFLAEAYWGLEDALCETGFDWAYDKGFYDELIAGDAQAVKTRLSDPAEALARRVRFVENHDEPRAAAAMPGPQARAAAVLAALAPGAFLMHDGQELGLRVRTPVQLARQAHEEGDGETLAFYEKLLGAAQAAEVGEGRWKLLSPAPAWHRNPTWRSFVAFLWSAEGADTLVVVNFGPTQAQCKVRLPRRFGEGRWRFADRLGAEEYVRDGGELTDGGMFFDMVPWGWHAFFVERA